MKKTLLVLMIMVIGFSAFAGGSSENDSTKESASSLKEGVFWNDKPHAVYDQNLKEAWAQRGFDAEINAFADVAPYQTALSQSIDSPELAPNIFSWWSGSQLKMLAESGKLMPLDDVWEDIIEMGVSPDIKSSLSFDGVAYGVPYGVFNNVIIYNMNTFEKAGIEEIPETFDEFLVVCDKLLAAGITPIGIKNDSWASFIWFQAIVASFDPELYIGVCDGSIKYTDDKMFEVFEIWGDMIEKGYFADPVSDIDNERRIATGECSMYIEPQQFVITFETQYGLMPGVDIDMFALPSMTGGKDVIFFEVAPLAIPAVADPIRSKEFVTEFFSQEVQACRQRDFGQVLLSTSEVENPTLAKLNSMVADTENYRSILRYYENTPSELRDFALNELSKFSVQVQDAETTLTAIQEEAEKYF